MPAGGRIGRPPQNKFWKNDIGRGCAAVLRRPEDADDHMRWYCKQCGALVYDADFHLVDLGKQLKPIIEEFRNNEELRTCKSCGTIYQL